MATHQLHIFSEGVQCFLFLYFASFSAEAKFWFPMIFGVQVIAMAIQKVLDEYCFPVSIRDRSNASTVMFKHFDVDGDGKIDESELKKMLPKASPDEIKKIVSEADRDGDGKLDATEIAAAS